MKSNNIKLLKNSKLLIIDRAIGQVISVFLTIFLSAYFYKLTQDNMIYISIYHIITYIVATAGAFFVSNYIKRKNKMKMYLLGNLLKALYVLLIIVLKEKILNYIWIIGACYGVIIATTGFTFNMIESEQVEERERPKYMGYRSAIEEIIGVVVPFVLGIYITLTSYQIAGISILLFTLLKVIIISLIKNKSIENRKTNFKKFWLEVNKHKEYPILKIYIIEFLKGITRYGVLSSVITLLIIYEVKTDLNLGIWSSIFSACAVITMMIFGKYYTKQRKNQALIICSINIIMGFILIFISINKMTIIIYNLIYYIFINILLAITEVTLFDYSNKEPFDKELNTEYFIFREVFLNTGRILGYSLLLLVGISHDMEYLKLLFLIITIALFAIIIMSIKLDKNERYNG